MLAPDQTKPMMRPYLAATQNSLPAKRRRGNFSKSRLRCSSNGSRGSAPSSAPTCRRRARPRSGRPSAGAPASRCRRSTACRSASRTSSKPSTCRPRWARRCLPAGVRKRTPPCVRALRDAGAVIVGKTVTTEFAASEPRGTRNPWNTAHTPGGSSSGSAASVAAGIVSAGARHAGHQLDRPPGELLRLRRLQAERQRAQPPRQPRLSRARAAPASSARRSKIPGRSPTRSSPVSAAMPERPACKAPTRRRRRRSRERSPCWKPPAGTWRRRGAQAKPRRLRRAAEIGGRRRSAPATTTRRSRRSKPSSSRPPELSHRCNGWEARWFLRTMRERDASKLSRLFARTHGQIRELDARRASRRSQRARAYPRGLRRACRELRRLHHAGGARRARPRAWPRPAIRNSACRRRCSACRRCRCRCSKTAACRSACR